MTKVRELTEEQLEARDKRQLKLAMVLHTFVYGERNWTEEERENYLDDADAILISHPHLLPLNLRDDEDDPDAPNLPSKTSKVISTLLAGHKVTWRKNRSETYPGDGVEYPGTILALYSNGLFRVELNGENVDAKSEELRPR
jgi:hypothetical protein